MSHTAEEVHSIRVDGLAIMYPADAREAAAMVLCSKCAFVIWSCGRCDRSINACSEAHLNQTVSLPASTRALSQGSATMAISGAVVTGGGGAMARLSLLSMVVALLSAQAFLLPVVSHGEQLVQEESTLETVSKLWKKFSPFQTEDAAAADSADALTSDIVELRRGVLEVH